MIGCCSLYKECSDALHCLRDINDPTYSGCYYRKNIESGIIFYGENSGKVIQKVDEVSKPPDNNASEDYKIYLLCFDQPFAILLRHDVWKSSMSYQLKKDSYEKIKKFFKDSKIPHTTNLIDINQKNSCQRCTYFNQNEDIAYCKLHNKELDSLEICGKYEEKRQICDCRVVIEVEGEKYHILNWNSWLIPETIAEKIRKAFEKKGISSRVEKIGRWSAVDIPPLRQTIQLIAVGVDRNSEPEVKVEERKNYTQQSIFDMMGA